jgi:enamine deaminase RidA (YjgF/YER057c/UK114 family)
MKKESIDPSESLNLPFAAAIRAGDYIFVSGQVGHTDKRGNHVAGIEAQSTQCLENLTEVLNMGGAGRFNLTLQAENGLILTSYETRNICHR